MPMTGTVVHERYDVFVMWVRTSMKGTVLFEMETRTDSLDVVSVVIRGGSFMR